MKTKKSNGKLRPVVVCTEQRGVFFGWASDTSGKTVKLKNSRNAYYWSAAPGFMSLASEGPRDNSKIGAVADIELRNVTCVIECTEAAARRWTEIAPWVK